MGSQRQGQPEVGTDDDEEQDWILFPVVVVVAAAEPLVLQSGHCERTAPRGKDRPVG